MTDAGRPDPAAVEAYLLALQTDVVMALEALDGEPFLSDRWTRPEGGGGLTRVIEEGRLFERGGVNFSRVQGAQLLSVAIGPAAGGYVASHFGLRYAFFVTAGMCAIALVGLMLLFTEGRPHAADGEAVAGRESSFTLRDVLGLRGFPLVLGLLFIGQFIDRGLSLLVPLKVAVLPDVTRIAATSGEIISLAAICAAGAALVAGRLAQRWPPARLLLVGFVLGGLPCALMALAPGWQSLLLLRCLTGLCLGGALTLAYSLGGTLVSSERRGAAFGWLALSVQVGTAASPLVSGGLAALSLSGAFLLDGALAWLGAGVLLIGARRLRRACETSEYEQRSSDLRDARHCGGSIFHSPFSRTNAISPVSLSSPFWLAAATRAPASWRRWRSHPAGAVPRSRRRPHRRRPSSHPALRPCGAGSRRTSGSRPTCCGRSRARTAPPSIGCPRRRARPRLPRSCSPTATGACRP